MQEIFNKVEQNQLQRRVGRKRRPKSSKTGYNKS